MLESIISRFGYWGVGLGALVEGEASVLAAGALAHKGLLALPWVCLAAFLGTWLSNQVWFWSGRRFGKAFLARRPKLTARSVKAQGWLERYGAAFVVSLRFLYGLRAASAVWLGSSGYRYRRFVVLDTLGAVLWTSALLAIGWGVGATLRALLGRAGHAVELLIAAVLLAGLSFWFVRGRRRRSVSATSHS